MNNLYQWARRWNIPEQALQEFCLMVNVQDVAPIDNITGEQAAQQEIRIEAPKRGARLWRNNNGACYDKDGRLVRYGLANDSKTLSEKIKSSDLIGVTPFVITPQDVGKKVGIFTSIEVKKPGWRYTGTKREAAQLAWIKLMLSLGAIAQFATGKKDVWPD